MDNEQWLRLSNQFLNKTKCGVCRDNQAKLCARCANDCLKVGRVQLDYTYRMKRGLQKLMEKHFKRLSDKELIIAKRNELRMRIEKKREEV